MDSHLKALLKGRGLDQFGGTDTTKHFIRKIKQEFPFSELDRCCNYRGPVGTDDEQKLGHNKAMRALAREFSAENNDGSRDVTLTVIYSHPNKGIGRHTMRREGHAPVYAENYDSSKIDGNSKVHLTIIKRGIRNQLIGLTCVDLDIEVCHQTLMAQLFEKHELPVGDVLAEYLADKKKFRREMAEELGTTEDVAKELFNAIGNGGSCDYYVAKHRLSHVPRKARDYYADVMAKRDIILRQLIATDELIKYVYEQLVTECAGDPTRCAKRSLFSLLIHDIERRVIEAFCIDIGRSGLTVISIEYDGCKIKKVPGLTDPEVIGDHLRKAEAYIKKRTGYSVNFALKAMDTLPGMESIPTTELIPVSELYPEEVSPAAEEGYAFVDDPSETSTGDMMKALEEAMNDKNYIEDDMEAANIFIKETQNVKKTEDGRLFVRKGHVWTDAVNEVHQHMIEEIGDMNFYIKKKTKEGTKIEPYGGFTRNARAIKEQIQCRIKPTKGFIEALRSSSRGKLCFDDGVWDFAKRRFAPWEECPDVFTTVTTGRPFPKRPSQELMDEVRVKLFDNVVGPERTDQWLQMLARGSAGHFEDKRWGILMGERNSGKSVSKEISAHAFGKYVADIDSANLLAVRMNMGGDAARKMHFMRPCEFARLAFTNEVTVDPENPHVKLDGKIIKSITSGGDIQKSRDLYCPESSFVVMSTLFVLANDLPPIQPADALETAAYYRCPYKYASSVPEGLENMYKLADPDLKTVYIQRPDVLDAFTWLILDAYIPNKLPLNGVVAEETVQLREDEGDEMAIFRSRIKITGDVNDQESAKELMAKLKEAGCKLSKTKVVQRLKNMGAKGPFQLDWRSAEHQKMGRSGQPMGFLCIKYIKPVEEEEGNLFVDEKKGPNVILPHTGRL